MSPRSATWQRPDKHEDLVGDVLALEVAFWDMALSAD